MGHTYQIKEYGSFVCNKNIPGYVNLPEHTFLALEEFILTNHGSETDPLEIMSISARKGVGKLITAKNYVGLIKMKDGTNIEILPKIYSAIEDDENGIRTKKLLVEMLKTIRNAPYKTMQTTNVNIERMDILEVFIKMFIDEVYYIVKKGLKCSYESIEDNSNCFKGKMQFSKQIKYNFLHKERSYVTYEEFSASRPENRLLKSTLKYLYKNSSSSKNRNDIKILLNSFLDIEESKDYKADFAKFIPDRNMKDYNTALLWCKIFLTGKSFTAFSGSSVAVSLLFPMETLFESYVAALVRRELGSKGYAVSTQDRKYYLFDEPYKKFQVKPDIVVSKYMQPDVYVIDTKWKILSDNKANYGISQTDMYQMYAYHKKYNAVNVTLLYPKTESIKESSNIEFLSEDGVVVKIKFIDLFDLPDMSVFII